MGGVAILIKKNFKYTQLENLNITQEHIRIKCNNIFFIGVYNPPINIFTKRDLDSIMSSGPRVMLFGDLNCKHPHWDSNCSRSNTSGRNLDEFAESGDFIIHYPEDPTFFPYSGNTPSTLDIAVTKNLQNIDNIRTITTMTSDHDPVYLEIKTSSIIPRIQGQTYDYKTTDWQLYKKKR